MGPNNQNTVLEATNDISVVTPEGREATSGTLQWNANEGGDRTFSLTIKARSGWEIQKTFFITIFRIEGFPADLGNGEASPVANTFELTVCYSNIMCSFCT